MERVTFFQNKIHEVIEDYLKELRQPSSEDIEFVAIEDLDIEYRIPATYSVLPFWSLTIERYFYIYAVSAALFSSSSN